ncbi:MAG: hypothetical protein K0S45_2422 [Nitrospira sp.]|jgi:hypothetical protein|nr:hypothetical protein [Nitrospira sp.]
MIWAENEGARSVCRNDCLRCSSNGVSSPGGKCPCWASLCASYQTAEDTLGRVLVAALTGYPSAWRVRQTEQGDLVTFRVVRDHRPGLVRSLKESCAVTLSQTIYGAASSAPPPIYLDPRHLGGDRRSLERLCLLLPIPTVKATSSRWDSRPHAEALCREAAHSSRWVLPLRRHPLPSTRWLREIVGPGCLDFWERTMEPGLVPADPCSAVHQETYPCCCRERVADWDSWSPTQMRSMETRSMLALPPRAPRQRRLHKRSSDVS